MKPSDAFSLLSKSTVAILRLTGNQGRLVGTGFVVSGTPHVLTCSHVVQPYDANDVTVRYGVLKRRLAPGEVLDLRQAQISWIIASHVNVHPELDLAVLTLDTASAANRPVASQIGLFPAQPVSLSFAPRRIGERVAWLGLAVLGDLIATPRFFEGVIVSSYVNDSNYTYPGPGGLLQSYHAQGLELLEVNQMFIPGCSGGPVANLADGSVIGYVHGYGSWPVGLTPGVIDIDAVQLTTQSTTIQGTLRQKAPVIAALSRAIDVRSIQSFLRQEGIPIQETNYLRRIRTLFGS